MNILLIHGLGRTPLSISGMGKALKQVGHRPDLFGYTTLTESFDEITARLCDRLHTRLPPFKWFAGQSGENMASPQFYTQLPALRCPYTIITGTAGQTGALSLFGEEINDFVVSAKESKMHEHDVPIEVPALHSFIMNNKVKALTTKAFS